MLRVKLAAPQPAFSSKRHFSSPCRGNNEEAGVCLAATTGGPWLARGPNLRLCSPAPTRNRQQEKQRCSVKETHVGDGIAARSTHVEKMYVKSIEGPKDQREDSADQT